MKFSFKKTICFFYFSFFLFNVFGAEEGRWGFIDTIKNNTNYDMYLNIRWKDRELFRYPYWNWNPPKLSKGQVVIKPWEKIKIKPRQELHLSNCEIPQSISSGISEEEKILIKGMADKFIELPVGIPLSLNPLKGKGVCWLKTPINDEKSLAFWAQTDDEIQIMAGEKITSADYNFKVIIGPKGSQIVTREEENQMHEKTALNKIKFGDSIYLENVKTGERLHLLPKELPNEPEDTIISIPPENSDVGSHFTIADPNGVKDETRFIKDRATIFLVTNTEKYFGHMFSDKPFVITRAELNKHDPKANGWIIHKVDISKDKTIRHKDIVKLEVFTDNRFMAIKQKKERGKTRITTKTPKENNDNEWYIYLTNSEIDLIPEYPYVTRQDNPNAISDPGFNGIYWISVLEDLVFIGRGYKPGKNIFLFRKLPKELIGKINFLGVSSNNRDTQYANFLIGPPITLTKPHVYKNFTEEHSIEPLNGNYKPTNIRLRSSNKGSVSLQIKGKSEALIGFSSDKAGKKLKYVVEIGADNNKKIRFFKMEKNKPVLKAQNSYPATKLLSEQTSQTYNIGINNGLVTVEHLTTEQKWEVLLVWQDYKPFKQYPYINLGTQKDPIEYSKISISSALNLDYKKAEVGEYEEEAEKYFKAEDKIPCQLIIPYEYWIRHVKFNINLKEKLYLEESFNIAAMPTPGESNFRVEVLEDGTPIIFPSHDPIPGPLESILKVTAGALGGIGESMSGIPNPKAAAVGMAVGAAGSIVEGIAETIFTPVTEIYTEEARIATAQQQIIPEVEEYNQEISNYLSEIEQLSIDENFKTILELYHRIFDRIVSPRNIKSTLRKRLLRELQELYSTSKSQDTKTYNNKLINLFIKAYDNVFFLNPKDKSKANQRDELYRNINLISNELFKALEEGEIKSIKIFPYHGEFTWLNKTLPQKNIGAIIFEASARSDIIVGFHRKKFKVRQLGKAEELYQVMIGGWNNKITAICSDGNAQIETLITERENPDAMAQAIGYRKYWMEINNGLVRFGIFEQGSPVEALRWKDPYHLENIKYIGFSSWNSKISLKNIRVGSSIKELMETEEIEEEVIETEKPAETVEAA